MGISGFYKTKAMRAVHLCMLAAFVVSMTVFGIFDLQISKAVVNQGSVFGKVFAEVGELPGWMILPLFFSVAYHRAAHSKALRVAILALVPATNLLWVRGIVAVFNLDTWLFWIISIGLSVIMSVVFLALFSRARSDNLDRYFRIFLTAFIFIVANIVLVNIIKFFWGRVRFRSLTDDRDFSRWFIPQGYNGNRSFPSGHVAGSSGILALILFCQYFAFRRRLCAFLAAFAAGFILCTAVSRVRLGAHYCSDVTFSLFLSYYLFIGTVFVFDKVDLFKKSHNHQACQ